MVALCGCSLLLATAAAAAPSHLGPTGVVGTPTADVVAARQFDVAADYVKWSLSGTDITSWPIRLVAGVSDNVEVGVGYTKCKDGGSLKATPVNVKAVVVPESESSPAIAIGAAYAKLKDGSAIKVTTFYAVASKTLSEPADEWDDGGMTGTLRGSLGVMYNKYSNGGSDSYTKPFASLEYSTPGGTTLAFEYKSKEDDFDPVWSLLARHMVTPNAYVQAGWTNAFYTFGADDHDFFIGVGYSWAPPAEEEWY